MVRWPFIPYRPLKCFLIDRCNILVPEHEVTFDSLRLVDI